MLNLDWSQSIQNYSVTDKFLRDIYPVLCWTCGAILPNLKVSFLTHPSKVKKKMRNCRHILLHAKPRKVEG